ncbi:MAG TPA: RsmD family RNA methyltransferase [Longimicrobiales bacterium]|nr:RsmD family RNA methyltransferase [Longimicrobiales bacterium]
MRIVGGAWAGRDLTSPGGRVRPTAEPVREACMRLVEDLLPGARVLDLYAGTGALGLEAMSRGAKRVDFVEGNPEALHSLKANIAALRVRNRTRIFKRPALEFLEGIETPYEVAFADPPYQSKQGARVVERWLASPFSRVLLVEHSSAIELPRGGRSHRVGETTLTMFGDRSD